MSPFTGKLHAIRLAALLSLAGAPACNNGDGDTDNPEAPVLESMAPSDGDVDVAINGSVEAGFSLFMDPASMTPQTFQLAGGTPAVGVSGTVITTDSDVVFWPSAHLASNTEYTATVTTGALSVSGVPLGAEQSWSFTTGTRLEPGQPVNLGTAADHAILAKSGESLCLALRAAIVSSVDVFSGEAPQTDDQTLVIVRRLAEAR